MKMRWEEPKIEVQMFMPNEYVAACWKINCNVPLGIGFYDTNNNGKYDESDQKICRSNPRYGCGEWHKGVAGVPDDGPTANAMWQPVRDGLFGTYPVGDAYPVYYWSDGNGDSHKHFSKVEDAEWETNINAS